MREFRPLGAVEVGLSLIGGEHQHQHRLVAAVQDALTASGTSAATELSQMLLHYTQVHAMSEELLMRLYRYPDADPHVRDHSDMMKKARRIVDHQRAGDAVSALDALSMFSEALNQHSVHDDPALERHLADVATSAALTIA